LDHFPRLAGEEKEATGMNWELLRAAKQAEIDQLTNERLSEVTPSIRNFAQCVTTHKQDLVFIAALKRIDPQTGRSWHGRDLVALAEECDDAEVGAIAVYTEPTMFGTSLENLKVVSAAVSAPVLRLDLILHPSQIHQARLHGADAVLLQAGAVNVAALSHLVTIASSTHTAPVIVVQTQAEIEQALTAGAFILGITSPSGTRDLPYLAGLAAAIPPQKTVIVVEEISTAEEYAALQGKVDAVLIGNVVLDAPEVNAVLAELAQK
jgi:indole-3-glycerol phosphate synthase